MKNFLDKHFSTLIIVALFLFLYMKGTFNKNVQPGPTITIVSDTTDKQHKGSVTTRDSKEIKYIPYPVEKITKEVLADSAYVRAVINDYLSTRVQKDSIKVDSIGTVSATTYTTKNRVDSTKWDFNIRERTINNTVTINNSPKLTRQLFLGAEISTAYPAVGINQFSVGALYKNKKNQILGASTGYNLSQKSPVFDLKYYTLFSLRKKP